MTGVVLHDIYQGRAVLGQMERLDAVKASLKKLSSGITLRTPAPRRISRLSSSHTHTCSDDDGVPPIMTASFFGPFPQDGFLAVAEGAPSSNASKVGDEDPA